MQPSTPPPPCKMKKISPFKKKDFANFPHWWNYKYEGWIQTFWNLWFNHLSALLYWKKDIKHLIWLKNAQIVLWFWQIVVCWHHCLQIERVGGVARRLYSSLATIWSIKGVWGYDPMQRAGGEGGGVVAKNATKWKYKNFFLIPNLCLDTCLVEPQV